MLFSWKRPITLCMVLLASMSIGAQAQTVEPVREQPAKSVVTVSVAGEQARFATDVSVAQMRLEVFAAGNVRLFDSDFKPGGVLDWPLRDQQGEGLPDGDYRCQVTVKDLTGRTWQKRGEVKIRDGVAALAKASDEAAIQDAGSQNLIGRETLLALLNDGLTRATAILVHDGDKARLASGSGGLSFLTGDFFMGKDIERMRLIGSRQAGMS